MKIFAFLIFNLLLMGALFKPVLANNTGIVQATVNISICGDLVKNGTEECDNQDLGNINCSDLGYEGGQLGCDASCQFNISSCKSPIEQLASHEKDVEDEEDEEEEKKANDKKNNTKQKIHYEEKDSSLNQQSIQINEQKESPEPITQKIINNNQTKTTATEKGGNNQVSIREPPG